MTKIRGFEKVSKFNDNDVQLPKRSTTGSAGYDFFALETITIPGLKGLAPKSEDVVKGFFNDLTGNKTKSSMDKINELLKPTLVKTGVKAYMQDSEFLQLANRSSNPLKKYLLLANGVGIIDSDYYNNESNEGHIMFQFVNFGPEDVVIKKGDAIGQGIFLPFLLTDDDVSSGKRIGGHGSTS